MLLMQCADDATPGDTQATPTDHSSSPPRNRTLSSRKKATLNQRKRTPLRKHYPEPSSMVKKDLEELRKKMGSHSGGPVVLLGIESSCDDSAAAVVDERGRVLGEALLSQMREHQK